MLWDHLVTNFCEASSATGLKRAYVALKLSALLSHRTSLETKSEEAMLMKTGNKKKLWNGSSFISVL